MARSNYRQGGDAVETEADVERWLVDAIAHLRDEAVPWGGMPHARPLSTSDFLTHDRGVVLEFDNGAVFTVSVRMYARPEPGPLQAAEALCWCGKPATVWADLDPGDPEVGPQPNVVGACTQAHMDEGLAEVEQDV